MTQQPSPNPDAQRLLGRLSEMERRIAELEDELIGAQRLASLGTLAGAIAHEVNNILTPVLSYARMAQAAPDDLELGRKAIEKAELGALRATKVASAILGCLVDGREDQACVKQAVEQAIACLVREPHRDGIELTVQVEEDCIAAIPEAALQQVLLNLLLNATKALRSVGGGRLHIRAHRSTWNTGDGPPLESIEIAVRDSGPGIPRAVRDHLFEPLGRGVSRVRTARSASDQSQQAPRSGSGGGGGVGGVGLGLAICRRLVESAGGRITVQSGPGEGATFTITLPAAPVPAPADHAAA
ncbi:MAG: sensor histidine kinase [Phycisphaeraceae bacterium]|nr:MAG: sensor histidine kinase [Phycisphaeraceae bacterium]